MLAAVAVHSCIHTYQFGGHSPH